jgi:DNA-binding NarL/FixJ family response regulator
VLPAAPEAPPGIPVGQHLPCLVLYDVLGLHHYVVTESLPDDTIGTLLTRLPEHPTFRRPRTSSMRSANTHLENDIRQAREAGADDFLSKPVNKLELLKRVENMLRLKDVRDENERLRRYIEEMEDDAGKKPHHRATNHSRAGSGTHASVRQWK